MVPAIQKSSDETLTRSSKTTDQMENTIRSGYGTPPGAELPISIYVSVFAGYAWIVLASWIAFANGADAELALGMAGVLTVVFFALPLLVWLTAKSHADKPRGAKGDFLTSHFETATGTITGASAWLQIAIIPASLALAATLIGITSMLEH